MKIIMKNKRLNVILAGLCAVAIMFGFTAGNVLAEKTEADAARPNPRKKMGEPYAGERTNARPAPRRRTATVPYPQILPQPRIAQSPCND